MKFLNIRRLIETVLQERIKKNSNESRIFKKEKLPNERLTDDDVGQYDEHRCTDYKHCPATSRDKKSN